MATLINLPHEVQDLISNYFRKIDPFSKAPGVASIKAVHSNLKAVSFVEKSRMEGTYSSMAR